MLLYLCDYILYYTYTMQAYKTTESRRIYRQNNNVFKSKSAKT